jgi:DNA-binding beta-propeller fold protein YncE
MRHRSSSGRLVFSTILVGVLPGLAACSGKSDGDDVSSGTTTAAPDDTPDGTSNDTDDSGDSGETTTPPAGSAVVFPIGETVFFTGDDYIADLGAGASCTPEVVSSPDGAAAAVVDNARLTPDVTGEWALRCGEFEVTLDVRSDTLNEDTFLNYNYTPVSPVAAVNASTLLVATPTSNAVQVVSTGDAPAAGTLIPTGAWPTSVAWWEGGSLALVAQTGRDSLGFLDPSTEQVVDAIRVGDEPAGIVVVGDVAYVTISGEDRVVAVDLLTRTVTGSADTGRDPRALTVSPDGRYLYVASLLSSNEHRFGTTGVPTEPLFQRDVTVVDTATFDVVQTVPEVGTMLRGMWTDGDRIVMGVSHSNNDVSQSDGTQRPHAHGLAVLPLEDGLPTGVVEHIDLDQRDGSTGPAPSPFTILPTPDGEQLVVSLSAGASLLLLDRETLAEEGRIPTGNDPRGLVVQGDTLWTTPWLDNQAHGFALPLTNGEAVQYAVDIGNDPRPEAVRQGQQLFNDARFSGTKEFSCNNCHIDGVVDGLTWDLLVDGNVNTLAFRNVAGTDPFLWEGLLPTLFDFSREVLKLVGANATGEEMEALTVYMQSITAPPNPHTLPGGRYTDQALRGRDLFDTAVADGGGGCIACHSGPLFTNQATVTGKTAGMSTDVPGLIGVYDSAPYGRQGSWGTLSDMVDGALDYTGAHDLSADQRADLLAYLEQVPGDALWLNGSLPLSGDDYTSVYSPIELTFSSVLAPNQAHLASIVYVDSEGEEQALAGEWETSGRVLRFVPSGALLEGTTHIVRVDGGLQSNLGRVMADELEILWATGSPAELDLSGRHKVTLLIDEVFPGLLDENPVVEFATLQSSGGNVTAVVHYDDLGIELSHAEGVVVGSRFIVQPFRVNTEFGPLQLDDAFMDLTDLDGDGYADEGVGTAEVIGYTIPWVAERLSLPE